MAQRLCRATREPFMAGPSKELNMGVWEFALTMALFSGAISASAQDASAAGESYGLAVATDRPDALYHVGEKATFKMTLTKGGVPADGEVEYVFTLDGSYELGKGKVKISSGVGTVTGTLGEPGFLRCDAMFAAPDGTEVTAAAAAGFDPLAIKPSMPVPDDFDAFWAEQKGKLAAVPARPVLTPIGTGDDKLEGFDLQMDCPGGSPVSCYYVRPAKAAPHSLPAYLHVQAAGVRTSHVTPAAKAAQLGMIAIDLNAHGLPNGQSGEYYKALYDGRLKDYEHAGSNDREKCYFLGMFLRMERAMQFLMEQPEWDGRVLIVEGGSQGGAQALVAAGLEPRVSAVVAMVPALCENTGKVNGWPRFVRPDRGPVDQAVFKASRYFDAMNFVTRGNAEYFVGVGFIDGSCRPTSVYAMYNNIKGRKTIVNAPLTGHDTTPEQDAASEAFKADHIARSRAAVRPAAPRASAAPPAAGAPR